MLNARVVSLSDRQFEKGDWSYVYHAAKKLPPGGWSNLNIDVMHKSLGVEHKMLCVRSDKNIKEYCGVSLMHPAATRSIRIPPTTEDPTAAARDVLRQYAELIEQRRRKIAENAPDREPDLRVGWLLWQESLKEFLYFEQEMLSPNPSEYSAEWKESGGGARKASKNLWVYETKTGRKRFSITTSAGAKIQPYFDVPPPTDPNLYYFWVQGEEFKRGLVRVWVTATTALFLKQLLGDLDQHIVSTAIIKAAKSFTQLEVEKDPSRLANLELAEPLLLTTEAYAALTETFVGVSDEHMMQLFVRYISQRKVVP